MSSDRRFTRAGVASDRSDAGTSAVEDVERAYREIGPAVLGYLRGAGVADPENELGEVFVAVVARYDRFDGDAAALRRWVFTIAHNRIVDAHRKRGRRRTDVVAVLPDREAPRAPDPVDEELLAALGGLAADQRSAVLLRFVADLPLADVAAILDRTPAAVKKLQARALARLRRDLSVDEGSAATLETGHPAARGGRPLASW